MRVINPSLLSNSPKYGGQFLISKNKTILLGAFLDREGNKV
jgi:hypothetical protein